MKKVAIGLSVYPDFQSYEQIEKQLTLAHSLGYTDVFTSMQLNNLGFENTPSTGEDFHKVFRLCRKLGIRSHVDINDEVFKDLGCTLSNLKPLKDLGIDVLRLDGGFGMNETVQLTLNTEGIIIEDNPFNLKAVFQKVHRVIEKGNPKQYRMCHNFFPRNETGLDFEETISLTQNLVEAGIPCGIFITSQYSPNDLNASGEGVCTIEDHRYLPPELAFSELRNTEVFDCILFGDSYPREEDLRAVSDIAQKDYCELEVWLEKSLSLEQRKVILETLHHNRADTPALVIRSTQTRLKMKVSPERCIDRPYGTITLDNDRSNRYEGELQISLGDLGPNPVANIAGMVKPTCKRLLQQVKYNQVSFKLKE